MKYSYIKTGILGIATILLALSISCYCLSVRAYAAEDQKYDVSVGNDGSVTATIHDNEDGTYSITVTGNGEMKDYKTSPKTARTPWYDNRTKISSVKVEEGITHIGNHAFRDSNVLSSVELPDGLKTIGSSAFLGNKTIMDISVPASVSEIKNLAFNGCTELTLTVLGNNTVLVQTNIAKNTGKIVKAYEDSTVANNWLFTQIDEGGTETHNATQFVSMPSYQYVDEAKTEVSKYIATGTDITVIDSIRIIGDNTFADNSNLVNVNLNKVESIGSKAFANCSSLRTVTIPNTVDTIAIDAFVNSEVKLLVSNNTKGYEFATENGFDYEILKPHRRNNIEESTEKEILINDSDVIDLDSIFEINYNSSLKYQVKIGDSDFQNIEGAEYSFAKEEPGKYVCTFRALDENDEPSDDLYIITYNVVRNNVPVLNPDKAELRKRTLYGESVSFDLSDAFSDEDGDQLTYRFVDLDSVKDDYMINEDQVDWENEEHAHPIAIDNGILNCPDSWIEYPKYVGKDHVFWIRAYDKWNKPSDAWLILIIEAHSAEVIVNKGLGVHSLEEVSFSFSREGAEAVTKPAKVVDDHYFFDLEYVTFEPYPGFIKYQDGYDYTYTVSLDGCETVTGTTKILSCQDPAANNTIEVTLSNPTQAEADAKAVADLIKAIDNLGDITLDSEDAVNAAQAAYEALYDDLKPQVTNYEVLHLSKLVLSSLKAQKAAEEAQAAAEEAERKAKIEQQNAKDAQDKAETAQQKAEEAQSKAETAQEAAETAKGEAEAAKLAAETAKGEAEAAKQAAETAKGEAETAKAEAETAKQAAETAKAEAEAAQQKAEKAAQEASSSDSETSKQIKELQDTLEKTAAELAALKDTLAAKGNKVTGLKLKSKARKITVTWKKNADADGYQVQFKLKSAKKYKTLKTLTGIKAVSKKLKKGKKYQFRVATYKTVNGKKIYGKWVTKAVKCK